MVTVLNLFCIVFILTSPIDASRESTAFANLESCGIKLEKKRLHKLLIFLLDNATYFVIKSSI